MMNTQQRGFDITYDAPQAILHLRLWGLWDEALGQEMLAHFKQQVQTISAQTAKWSVLADLTQFPAQIEAVQQSLIDAMTFARTHGMKKAARVVANTITKLQIKRLSEVTGIPEHSFFQSKETALAWLKSE